MMMKRVLAVGATALIALAAAAAPASAEPKLTGKCLGDEIAESRVNLVGGIPIPGCGIIQV